MQAINLFKGFSEEVRFDEALEKVRILRSMAPNYITTEIANLMTTLVNTPPMQIRKSISTIFPMLASKILDLIDYWAVKQRTANMNNNSQAPISLSSEKVTQIIQDEWQDYRNSEHESLVPGLKEELDILRSFNLELQTSCSDLERALKDTKIRLDQDCAALRLEVAGLKVTCLEQEDELFLLRKNSSMVSLRATTDRVDLLEQQERNNSFHLQISTLEKRAKDAESEKEALTLNVSQLEEELSIAYASKKEITFRVEQQEIEIKQLQALEATLVAANQAKTAAENAQRKAEESKIELDRNVVILTTAIQKREKKLKKAISQLETMVAENQSLRETSSHWETEAAGLQASIKSMSSEISMGLRRCDILETELDESRMQTRAVESDLALLRMANELLHEELETIKVERDKVLVALVECQRRIGTLMEEAESKRAREGMAPARSFLSKMPTIGGLSSTLSFNAGNNGITSSARDDVRSTSPMPQSASAVVYAPAPGPSRHTEDMLHSWLDYGDQVDDPFYGSVATHPQPTIVSNNSPTKGMMPQEEAGDTSRSINNVQEEDDKQSEESS